MVVRIQAQYWQIGSYTGIIDSLTHSPAHPFIPTSMYLDSSLTVNEPFMYKVEEQLVECIATRMILPQFIEHRAQHLKGRHSGERQAERQRKDSGKTAER